MKYIYLILFCGLMTAQEFQVEGDLTVSGEIQSATTDSIRSDINELYSIIDSLYSLVNANKPIKLITYNMNMLLPTEDGWNIVVFDTTFTSNEFEEFIRVELNVFSDTIQGAGFNLYFGPIGFEEEQGNFHCDDTAGSNTNFDNYNPQLWWNIPIINDIGNEQIRLYITVSNQIPFNGRISKLFIWGR
jgi:hypothetical protein